MTARNGGLSRILRLTSLEEHQEVFSWEYYNGYLVIWSRTAVLRDRVNPLLVGKGETSRPTKDGLVLAAVHHGLQDPSECGRASFESR